MKNICTHLANFILFSGFCVAFTGLADKVNTNSHSSKSATKSQHSKANKKQKR